MLRRAPMALAVGAASPPRLLIRGGDAAPIGCKRQGRESFRFLCKHLLDVRAKLPREGSVDLRGAGQNVAGLQEILTAIEAGNDAAGFTHDERAGRKVPNA